MAGYTHPVEMSCGLVKDKLSLHTWEPHCLSIPESTLRWHLPSPGLSPETMAGPEPLMYWPYMGEHSIGGCCPKTQAHTALQTQCRCIQPLMPVPQFPHLLHGDSDSSGPQSICEVCLRVQG